MIRLRPRASVVARRQRVDHRSRIAFLEATRGIAAALVVVHHVASLHFAAYRRVADYVDLGRLGVVTFFLVSGYVITLSLEHGDVRTFAVRRFWRLYPVYWTALLAMLVVVPADLPGHAAGSPSPAMFGLNILMLNGFAGAVGIIGPAWTLTIELVFYVQAAIAKSRGRLDRSVHMGWVWLAAYVLACAIGHVGPIVIPRSLPLFLFLAALGQAVRQRDRDGSSRTWAGLAVAGAVGVPLGAWIGVDPAWHPLNYDLSTLAGVLLFATLYAVRGRDFPRVLLWLGSISYAVYLFHEPVLELCAREGVSRWGTVAIALVSVPLVGWAVHRGVERPCIRVGKRLSGRGAQPAGQVTFPATVVAAAPPRRPMPGPGAARAPELQH